MAWGQRLAVREYTVETPGLDRGSGLRIAQISDFHFRAWNPVLDEARWRLMEHDYDVLAATGDYSSIPRKWRHAASMCRRFFEGIAPPMGIYAVLGNHDRFRTAHQPGLPMRWLHNTNVRLKTGGGEVYLAGVDQCEGQFGDVNVAIEGIPKGAPIVLLAHYPSTAYDLKEGQVDLLLSGHTHGGQIRLPHFGCIFTNDRIPTSQARGLHRIGGSMVHVSAGVGVSGPIRRRFRCPAEISIITLKGVRRRLSRTVSKPARVPKPACDRELATSV